MTYEYLNEKGKIIENSERFFTISDAIAMLERYNKLYHDDIEGYRLLLMSVEPYIGIKLQV